MLIRHLHPSFHGLKLLASSRGSASLFSLETGALLEAYDISKDVDGRVCYAPNLACFACADFMTGIKTFDLATKAEKWHVKVKGVSKLRLSQDSLVLIACRNDPPEVILIELKSGRIIERVPKMTDGFLESRDGKRIFLTLRNELFLASNEGSAIRAWGQFAIHSGCFAGTHFFVSGTNATIGKYNMNSLECVELKSFTTFVKCDPIIVAPCMNRLLGVIFEPEGKSETQLVAFNADLSINKVILKTDLVWGAAFCDDASSLVTTNGTIFSCSEGVLGLVLKQ